MDNGNRDYGRPVFGEDQDNLFNSLSLKQREAIGDARYGRDGWIVERCVKPLRTLEILRADSRQLTTRGMQMMNRLKRDRLTAP